MIKKAVVIIGSGPAGISTALSLINLMPELSNDILILEKEKHPRPKLCGGGVTAYAEQTLRSLNIRTQTFGFPIHTIEFYIKNRPLVFRRKNLMRIVRRDEFDAELAQHARNAGIELKENEPVVSLTRKHEKINVTTENDSYLTDVLVGADGAKSFVRKKMLHEPKSRISRLMEIVVPAESTAAEFQQHTATFDFRAMKSGLQGYLWTFPGYIHGKAHYNLGIFDSRIKAGKRADMRQLLKQYLSKHGISGEDVPLQGHPERWFTRRGRYAVPNVLLVGDAAGIEPWLGEGISIALGYGPVAARAIQSAFQNKDFSFRNYTNFILDSRLGKQLNRNLKIANLMYKIPSQTVISGLAQLGKLLFDFKYNRHEQA